MKLPKARKINSIRVAGKVAWLELTKGQHTRIDLEDVGRVAAFRWSVSMGGANTPYARTASSGEQIALHRLIADAPSNKVVDHISGDTLDNRKSNLRVCEHFENLRNQKSRRVDGLKGITFDASKSISRPWTAFLHLGHFETKEQAARIYDKFAALAFGPFARLNYAALALILCLFLSSCSSLIPRRVEFFQDKVQKFPEQTAKHRESERQAVALAAIKAREAERIATDDDSAAAKPAGEAAQLSEAMSRSLGPPETPWKKNVAQLVERLDKTVAQFNDRLLDFKKDNNENAGKKIEGTGAFGMPYFVWLFIVGSVVLVIFFLVRTFLHVAALGSPPVAAGLAIVQAGGKVASKAVGELVKGGENFKNYVKENWQDLRTKQEILDAFKIQHERAQSVDVQNVVKDLTK